MSDTQKAHLIDGSVGGILFRLTVPMIAGIVAMMAFNLVDTYFVGRLGTAPLAAMGFTFPVVMIVAGLSRGIGVGASAVISRAIGEGDWDRVRRLTTDSLILSVLVVAPFVGIGMLTIVPVFRLLGAEPEMIRLIRQYMIVWYPGMVFVVVPMVGNHAIRATGDTIVPSLIMLVAVAVNTALDPLLIFGIGPFPRMELAGAAVATVSARATTLVVALCVLHYRKKMLTFGRPRAREVWESWKAILYIAAPNGGTSIVFPVGIGFVTGLVARYGKDAVAAFGVASKIEIFALTVIIALATVLAPFVGQNQGAGRHGRVQMGVRISHRFAMAWGLVVFVLLGLAARPIASAFTKHPDVIAGIALYLEIVPVSYGLQGVMLLSSVTLNVLNRPLTAAFLTLFHILVLYIPLAYLGAHLLALPGVFAAATAAKTMAGVAAWWVLRKVLSDVTMPSDSYAIVDVPAA